MARESIDTKPGAPPGDWSARLFGWAGGRRAPSSAVTKEVGDVAAVASGRSLPAVTRRLIAEDRYAFVLLREAADDVAEADARAAWRALEAQMALVPAGPAPVTGPDGVARPAAVDAFLLDRCAVTNRQFARFVAAGCYDALEVWPREVWAGLMRFVDRTGRPGPRTWSDGGFAAAAADHPVVGVCWYEALAYARWAGKRLPTAAEWQKAAGWPEPLGGGRCRRYPWGDLFAEGRANLWAGGAGAPAAVTAYREGSTPNGIRQLAGNVWEWLDDPLERIPCREGERLRPGRPLRRIAGGAFDTYLAGEATTQFVTGQPELDRRDNIGFRCALSVDRLRPTPRPTDPPTRSAAR